MITIEKDDFTGLRKINSSFYGLYKFLPWPDLSISDAFDLLYLETDDGQGNMVIRVCSTVAKFSGNTDWPHWNDNWPMIVDGERISLASSSTNSFEKDYELKVYDLPVDIFNKLCNAKEVKFSLRGRNGKIEGVLTNQHQTLLKAFEQYCFGDESEGKKLLESIDSSVSQNTGIDQAQNVEDSIIKPKNFTDEENKKHEDKVVDLIKEKKVEDAIKYYASNYGLAEDVSKTKVKELAEKNGLASIYKNYDNKQALYGCFGLIVIGFILMLLFFKAC